MASVASGALTKHGYPRGYRFVPEGFEIIDLLVDRLHGRPLPPQVAATFHDIHILDYHPRELYEQYKSFQEAGCIYFFSPQEFPRASIPGKKPRPVRTAQGGSWKPSGGAKPIKNGTNIVGKMVTMVFYDRPHEGAGADEKPVKTNWGLREFTVRLGPNKFSKLAAYRLYRVKNGAAKEGNQQEANEAHYHHDVPSAADHLAPSASAAGSSSATRQAFYPTSHQEQKQPFINIHRTQHYHDQFAFAATTAMPVQTTRTFGTNSHDDTKPPPVPDSFQFAASSSEQGMNNPQPPATDHQPGGHVAASPSQAQLVLPAVDEDYLSALLNGVPGDGILDPFDDIMFDGEDIVFSMEELTGTGEPSSGDGNNQEGGKQHGTHPLQF